MTALECKSTEEAELTDIEKARQLYQRRLRVAAITAGVIWVVLIAAYAVNFGVDFSDRQDAWGQFGDYLGGLLNPVFGFAGFVILLNTMHEQRLQIKEEHKRLKNEQEGERLRLEDERKRWQQQQAAQQQQLDDERQRFVEEHRARVQQSFESTFFRLLNRFSEVVGNISYSDIDLLLAERGKPPEGDAGFRPLINKYGILKRVKANELLSPDDVADRALYPEQATARASRRLEIFGSVEPNIPYD